LISCHQIDSYDDDAINITGEFALDRLSTSLGGKILMKVALQVIPNEIANQMWEKRHAALYAISSMAEGCKKEMEPHLANIVAYVFVLFIFFQIWFFFLWERDD
jgi:hypothetical protein